MSAVKGVRRFVEAGILYKRLSFPDRAITAALRVAEGDFRDWDEIKRWASGIADTLRSES